MQFIDSVKQQSFIREKLENKIRTVFNHGRYIMMGPEVKELEEKGANPAGKNTEGSS